MPDYSKGKIYKVINTQNEIIYIGSTIQQLSCRFCRHTHKGGGNKIILIENCPCSCKEELVKREQFYIDQYNNLYNKFRAFNSQEYNKEYKKKYRINNKEKIKEKDKEYYKNNKEKIKDYNKIYRINNQEKEKEKKKIYYEKNKEKFKEKAKEYRINNLNKEKTKEYHKEYYQKNREELCIKVKCDLCNTEVSKQYLTAHKKTKKCINNKICD